MMMLSARDRRLRLVRPKRTRGVVPEKSRSLNVKKYRYACAWLPSCSRLYIAAHLLLHSLTLGEEKLHLKQTSTKMSSIK